MAGFSAPVSSARTTCPTLITPCVVPATMPGSSRVHQVASTSRQGPSSSARPKYVVQSPTRRPSPSASAQFASVMSAVREGISSSRSR